MKRLIVTKGAANLQKFLAKEFSCITKDLAGKIAVITLHHDEDSVSTFSLPSKLMGGAPPHSWELRVNGDGKTRLQIVGYPEGLWL